MNVTEGPATVRRSGSDDRGLGRPRSPFRSVQDVGALTRSALTGDAFPVSVQCRVVSVDPFTSVLNLRVCLTEHVLELHPYVVRLCEQRSALTDVIVGRGQKLLRCSRIQWHGFAHAIHLPSLGGG